jgi:hypothetical protein
MGGRQKEGEVLTGTIWKVAKAQRLMSLLVQATCALLTAQVVSLHFNRKSHHHSHLWRLHRPKTILLKLSITFRAGRTNLDKCTSINKKHNWLLFFSFVCDCFGFLCFPSGNLFLFGCFSPFFLSFICFFFFFSPQISF